MKNNESQSVVLHFYQNISCLFTWPKDIQPRLHHSTLFHNHFLTYSQTNESVPPKPTVAVGCEVWQTVESVEEDDDPEEKNPAVIFFVVRHLQSINMASACILSTPSSSSSSAHFLLPSELLPSRAVKPTSLSWASSFPKLGIFGFVSNTSPPIPTLKKVCNFSYSLTFPSFSSFS